MCVFMCACLCICIIILLCMCVCVCHQITLHRSSNANANVLTSSVIGPGDVLSLESEGVVLPHQIPAGSVVTRSREGRDCV